MLPGKMVFNNLKIMALRAKLNKLCVCECNSCPPITITNLNIAPVHIQRYRDTVTAKLLGENSSPNSVQGVITESQQYSWWASHLVDPRRNRNKELIPYTFRGGFWRLARSKSLHSNKFPNVSTSSTFSKQQKHHNVVVSNKIETNTLPLSVVSHKRKQSTRYTKQSVIFFLLSNEIGH